MNEIIRLFEQAELEEFMVRVNEVTRGERSTTGCARCGETTWILSLPLSCCSAKLCPACVFFLFDWYWVAGKPKHFRCPNCCAVVARSEREMNEYLGLSVKIPEVRFDGSRFTTIQRTVSVTSTTTGGVRR